MAVMFFNSEPIKDGFQMKVLGWLLIAFSIAELFIGSIIFSWLKGVHVGAWWAAICSLLSGVCGVMSTNRYWVIAGFGFSAFGILLGIVGSIVEGISAAIFNAETGCINSDSRVAYGSSEGKVDASYCAGYHGNYESAAIGSPKAMGSEIILQHYNFYYNIPYDNNNNFYHNHPRFFYYYFYEPHYHYTNESYYANHNYFNNYQYSNNNNNYYYNHPYYFNYYYNHPSDDNSTSSSGNENDDPSNNNENNDNNDNNNNNGFQYYASSFGQRHQCICSDSQYCYGYTLTSGDDCGSILTTYSPLLDASVTLCVIITLLCLVYMVFSCLVACTTSDRAYSATEAGAYAEANADFELPPHSPTNGSNKPASPVSANLTALSEMNLELYQQQVLQQRYSHHLPAAPGLYGMAPQDSRAVVGIYAQDSRI